MCCTAAMARRHGSRVRSSLVGIVYRSGVMAGLAMGQVAHQTRLAGKRRSTPHWSSLREKAIFRASATRLGLPLMVKPANEGSSSG